MEYRKTIYSYQYKLNNKLINIRLGCIYGKGNQYIGKANVTISGNECLPWANDRIAHQLRINVGLFFYIYI